MSSVEPLRSFQRINSTQTQFSQVPYCPKPVRAGLTSHIHTEIINQAELFIINIGHLAIKTISNRCVKCLPDILMTLENGYSQLVVCIIKELYNTCILITGFTYVHIPVGHKYKIVSEIV